MELGTGQTEIIKSTDVVEAAQLQCDPDPGARGYPIREISREGRERDHRRSWISHEPPFILGLSSHPLELGTGEIKLADITARWGPKDAPIEAHQVVNGQIRQGQI